jgi:hypothetical protein
VLTASGGWLEIIPFAVEFFDYAVTVEPLASSWHLEFPSTPPDPTIIPASWFPVVVVQEDHTLVQRRAHIHPDLAGVLRIRPDLKRKKRVLHSGAVVLKYSGYRIHLT